MAKNLVFCEENPSTKACVLEHAYLSMRTTMFRKSRVHRHGHYCEQVKLNPCLHP
jgi:hypothetical protein